MTDLTIPPISCRTYIAAPPERVYDTLTTGAGWDAWFTAGTTVDPRTGGQVQLRWQDFGVERYTATAGGPVLAAERPRQLVFQWTPGDSTTTITLDLQPLGPGTIVHVTETGHTASPRDLAALVECAGGWGEALALLKFYLEHGVTYGAVPFPGD
jgi:uncharacterized protein YndB with AHSA1/START domain